MIEETTKTTTTTIPIALMRDLFAAFALAGLHAGDTEESCYTREDMRAAKAYESADAMLAEREKERP